MQGSYILMWPLSGGSIGYMLFPCNATDARITRLHRLLPRIVENAIRLEMHWGVSKCTESEEGGLGGRLRFTT